MAIFYNCYPMYGLNKYRSFLKAPENSKHPMYIRMDDEEEVMDLCCAILEDYECPDSAIFVVFQNGKYVAVFKEYDEDEDVMTFLKAEGDDIHFFSELDGELRFCCYNLIVEEKPGMWMIR